MARSLLVCGYYGTPWVGIGLVFLWAARCLSWVVMPVRRWHPGRSDCFRIIRFGCIPKFHRQKIKNFVFSGDAKYSFIPRIYGTYNQMKICFVNIIIRNCQKKYGINLFIKRVISVQGNNRFFTYSKRNYRPSSIV